MSQDVIQDIELPDYSGMPYKVADISEAEFGHKEITIAEQEMPGLMAICEKYTKEQPFKGTHYRFTAYDGPNRRIDPDA